MAGSLWGRIRRALKREKRDIEHALADVTRRGNEVLAEKERELNATPSELLRIEQARADEAADSFEELKRKIERDAN